MTRLFVPVPGRWVEFTEPDDCGEKIEGFYITEERAATFSQEPAFRKHVLLRVYVDAPELPAQANEAERASLKLSRKLKRVQKGVCPECNRSFLDLARHMACKHAGPAK